MQNSFRRYFAPLQNGAANVPIIGTNPRRRAIIFNNPATANAHFSTRPPDATLLGELFVIQLTNYPLLYKDVGDWVCAEWYGWCNGATIDVVITEIFLL
jgi:hypothetical protein